MKHKILQTSLFLFITLFLLNNVYSQSDSPYKLSMEGLHPSTLLPNDNSTLFRLDSLMYRSVKNMPLSYKLNQLELQYKMSLEREQPVVNLGHIYYLGRPEFNFKTYFDNLGIYYDGHRYKFMFDHGYFGPANKIFYGRSIPKSIYSDILYPWQNAPQSKFSTYKSLYLITNFVYPWND